MRFLSQFLIIAAVTLAGELLSVLLPLPVPAGIYGIVLLFVLLSLRVIRVEAVKDVSSFLIEIMPVMFVPAAAGLMESYDLLAPLLVPLVAISVISTFVVMGASGWAAQTVIRREQTKETKEERRHD